MGVASQAPCIGAQMIVSSHRLPHPLSWPRRITLLVLVGLVAATLSHAQVFWKQDEALYDRWVGSWRYTPDPRLLIIAIDAPSVHALGPLPWPRSTHAQLLDRLTEAGSHRVVMDLPWSDPDTEDASQDAELAAAIRRNGNVVLPVAAVPTRHPGVAEERLPIPMIAANASTLGHSDVEVDPDGISRGLYLTAGIGSPHWPALGVALAGRRPPLPGRLEAPPENASPWQWRRNHQVRVRFAGPARTFPQLSYVDVLQGRVDPGVLHGRLVLVGVTTPAEAPLLLTPSAPVRGLSGSEYQANVAAMLLDNKTLRLLPGWAQTLLSGVLVMLCGALLLVPRTRRGLVLAVPTVLLGSFVLLRLSDVWFAPVAAVVTLAALLGAWLAWHLIHWHRFIHTDPVTGLGTGPRLEHHLREAHGSAQRLQRPLSVVLVELDHFNALVDLHGLNAGNAALRAVASQLTAHARRPHDVSVRLGTDRFALLLPETNGEGALQVVEDLIARVRGLNVPVQLGQTTQVTVTAGLYSRVPDAASTPKVFMEGAKAALLRARSTGGDGYATDIIDE